MIENSFKRKRPASRVTFNEEKQYNECSSSLSEELVHEMWYSKGEITHFKREVGVTLLRRCRQKPLFDSSSQSTDPDDSSLWGLERHSFSRDRAKKATIKLIVLAQKTKEGQDPEILRSLSLECTKRPIEVALEQAFNDTCHSFYESSSETIVDECIVDSLPLFKTKPIPLVCKRPISHLLDGTEGHRRVRPRASAA